MSRQKTLKESWENPNHALAIIQKHLPKCLVSINYDFDQEQYIVSSQFKDKTLNSEFAANSLYGAVIGIGYNVCGLHEKDAFNRVRDWKTVEAGIPEVPNFYPEVDLLVSCGGEFGINSIPPQQGSQKLRSYIHDDEYSEQFFFSESTDLANLLTRTNSVAEVVNTCVAKAEAKAAIAVGVEGSQVDAVPAN